uniref:glycosyltransferase family 4 protein n=1 Tax=Tepidiphilus margaritifer TaxID=203471 RepID=UPI000685DD67
TNLADGGAEAVLYRLCTQAGDDACQHVVVSMMGEGKYGSLLRAAGVRVHCLNMPRGRVTWRGLRRLWQILRAERPDVVQTWMYHADLVGGVLARLAGLRAVCWNIRHSNLEPGKSRRATIWIARLNARLSRWVPAAIVCCAAQARDVHVRIGYAVDKFVIIPNGYDLGHLRPDAAARARLRAEWGVPDGVPLLGMVARFDPQKDHGNFIAACAHLQALGADFAAILVGTGCDAGNAELVRQIAAAGLAQRVRLLGPRTDVPAVMAALDVHVLSSLGEAFPNVLAEAMACGTPCVTTDVGDAAQIVGDTGWVVPPRNAQVLAAAVQAALEARRDSAAWAERQQRARQRIVDEFCLDRMVQRYQALWAQVANLNDPKAPMRNKIEG